MAEITARSIVTVTTNDGRTFAWDNTKSGTAPDHSVLLPCAVQALVTLQAEDAADHVEETVR
jgi:hypothetical protein